VLNPGDILEQKLIHFWEDNHDTNHAKAVVYAPKPGRDMVGIWLGYPLVNVYITMENHHVCWVNQLFRLGHGFNSKLSQITRGNIPLIIMNHKSQLTIINHN
jgi:hypothetical protein